MYNCGRMSEDRMQKTILYHRLLACARIRNGICDCVEHLDDNPLNCRVSNLLPSTQRQNVLRAFENKKRIVSEAVFKVTLPDLSEHTGTVRELSDKLNIPKCRYTIGSIKENLIRLRNTHK